MSDIRLKVYFSEGDKEEAYADNFSDDASHALGDNPLDVKPEDVLSKMCSRYGYPSDLLNLERYIVVRRGRVITVQPKDWRA